MTEIRDQEKDFFTWWKEDFAPAVVAAREALEPHVTAFRDFAHAASRALNQFLEEHQETIKLWQEIAEIYPKIQPYVDNMAKGLNDPDFEVANDVIQLAHLFEAIDIEQDPNSVSILTVLSSESFQNSLIDLYSNVSLDQLRLPLIKEALSLHNQGYYAGSISLLYGLIEGVLTESFEKANYLIINSEKVNPVAPDGTVSTNKNLTGLVPKLNHAITHQDQLQAYYAKIQSYELVNGDPDQTIPKTRNKILHGNILDFNTEKRSAQLIAWLYSTILHVRALGI